MSSSPAKPSGDIQGTPQWNGTLTGILSGSALIISGGGFLESSNIGRTGSWEKPQGGIYPRDTGELGRFLATAQRLVGGTQARGIAYPPTTARQSAYWQIIPRQTGDELIGSRVGSVAQGWGTGATHSQLSQWGVAVPAEKKSFINSRIEAGDPYPHVR